MAVEIIKFAKPKIWASLIAGGTLTIGQTYYFYVLAIKASNYYGAVVSPSSEQISITPTSGNQTIRMEWWQDGGDIITFADAGGGLVTVTTSIAHERSNGDTAYIRGTTNYDGTYTISNVTATTYDITVTWVSDDGASKWFADIGVHTEASGVFCKWDKYDMIDSGDGEPYQWLNLNDPANAAKDEYDETYGHRRWAQAHSSRITGTSIDFTQEAVTSTYVRGYLYDGLVLGSSSYSGRACCFTQIAWREPYYPIDSLFARDEGQLCVIFKGTGNTIVTFTDALKASGYDNLYLTSEGYNNLTGGRLIVILGSIFIESGAEATLNDAIITTIAGEFCHHSSSRGAMTTNRCTIMHSPRSNTRAGMRATFNDTIAMHATGEFDLDNAQGVNFTPRNYNSTMNYYNKVISGSKFVGGYGGSFIQWRYQRADNTSSMTDFYFKDKFIALTDRGGNYTGRMTRVEFVNEGRRNYEVSIARNYITGDCDKVMECVDVTCDRPDGKIKVYSGSNVHTVTDTWNMRFAINLNIVNENGDPIENAKIDLSWDSGSDTDNTDTNGEAVVTALSYTLNWDNTMGASYLTASDYKELKLKITANGYKDYEVKNIEIREGQDWIITLKKIYIKDFNIIRD